MPFDGALLRPAQDRHAGQLGAVVGDARGGLAARGDNRAELAPDPPAGKRGIGDERQAFAGEVVDDGEDAKPPAVAQLIMQEIQRPVLVWALRSFSGARVPRALAAAATANLEPFLGIEPAQFLVVQRDPLAPQQDVQPAVTEAPPDSGDRAQTGTQETILRPPAVIADRTAIRTDHLACPPLAHLVDLAEVRGGLSSSGGRHQFLSATPRSMALSSIASANSFFNLAFS